MLTLIGFEALAIAIPFMGSSTATSLFMSVLEYMVLAYSINLLTGFTGYVDFGHVVFFGIGAYATAVMVQSFHALGVNPYVFSIAGGLMASLFALILGAPILKIRGAYFAIATLGVSEAVSVIISNTPALGGSYGMPLAAYVKYDLTSAYLSMWILLLAAMAVTLYVANSKFGYGLRAIREDEDAAEAMGVNTRLYKVAAYVLSAFFAGVAGGIFGIVTAYIDTRGYFSVDKTVEMLVAMMLGGYGTLLGPLIGGFVLSLLEYTTVVYIANLHLLVFGVILILLVLFLPEGVVGVLRRRTRLVG